MRAVIQRVRFARVSSEGKVIAEIGPGLLILLGIEEADEQEDLQWLARKAAALRIFADEKERMNLCVKDLDEGNILLVSQFTLHASTKKGNRPSFVRAAAPDRAEPLYQRMIRALSEELGREIKSGKFGAHMQIELLNDGPVTIVIDTKNKE